VRLAPLLAVLLALMSGRGHAAPAPLEPPTYVISALARAHGHVLPEGRMRVSAGARASFRFTPDPGYHLDSLVVDGVAVRRTNVLVLRDVRRPHTVSARFSANEYVIVAAAGPHARITPPGIVPVPHGRSQTFLFGADSGFTVCELLVDDQALRASSRYTFANVRTHHRIEVRTTHHAARIIAPERGELWLAGESREVHWQPLEKERVDSAEVSVSCHGIDGPWEPIWRGLFRAGSAPWGVPDIDCDSLVFCVATIDSASAPGRDYSAFVRVRTDAANREQHFFVRAVPSPAIAGPVDLEYAVPFPGGAALAIYTVSGREVWRQPLGDAPCGPRSTRWDGRLAGGDLARPGIYFARLSTPHGERNCRLVLLP
jgi:hypothetical protein